MVTKASKMQKRWCVMAIFEDGHEVILRDFTYQFLAQVAINKIMASKLYPDNVYKLEVRCVLMEV